MAPSIRLGLLLLAVVVIVLVDPGKALQSSILSKREVGETEASTEGAATAEKVTLPPTTTAQLFTSTSGPSTELWNLTSSGGGVLDEQPVHMEPLAKVVPMHDAAPAALEASTVSSSSRDPVQELQNATEKVMKELLIIFDNSSKNEPKFISAGRMQLTALPTVKSDSNTNLRNILYQKELGRKKTLYSFADDVAEKPLRRYTQSHPKLTPRIAATATGNDQQPTSSAEHRSDTNISVADSVEHIRRPAIQRNHQTHLSEHFLSVVVASNYTDRAFQCLIDGHFPMMNNTCNMFISCQSGFPKIMRCQVGMQFNPITRLCDYAEHAQCETECPKRDGRYPVPSSCSKFVECNNGTGSVHSCPGDLHFNAVTKQCDPQGKAGCAPMCPMYDALVPVPGRCSLYIRCVQREVILMVCPIGLHFNPVKMVCDKAERAGCLPQCPEYDGLFPVIGQCSSYLECTDNKPKVRSCPSNLHFNFLIKACDLPEKAHCEAKCEKMFGYFSYPGVCYLIKKCVDGIPIYETCSDEYAFNPVKGQCDIYSRSGCLPTCPLDNGVFPVANHCDHMLLCSNGNTQIKRCPAHLNFNILKESCDLPERAKCQPTCLQETGVFPLVGRCSMFYTCTNAKAIVHYCPPGLHFNARTLTCDWPTSAHCQMSCPNPEGYYPIQGDCNFYVECNSGKPSLRACYSGLYFNFETQHCDQPFNTKCDLLCPDTNGQFTVPRYCDSYMECINGRGHIHSCPFGLLFNGITRTCDLPKNVVCDANHP